MVVLLAKQLSLTWFDVNGSNLHSDCQKRVQNVAIEGNISHIKNFLILCTQLVLCMDCQFLK